MRRLQQRFEGRLVVLGVHSAKFPAERETEAILRATEKHGIEHPIVNDRDFAIWQSYAIRAWPTVVLIDPDGYVVGAQPGEIDADRLGDAIERLMADSPGLVPAEAPAPGVQEDATTRGLRFPTRLAASGDRLWVAETGHHRILELTLSDDARRATVHRTFGDGRPDLRDGDADFASFHSPHGIALEGDSLLVADTDNHVIRRIDLDSGRIETIAGSGQMGHGLVTGWMDPAVVDLRSPWAVALHRGRLFIAMAGSHQIWCLDQDRLGVWAGNGREALVDGPLDQASFNQPSDLALKGDVLYVADAEASAVRAIDQAGAACVRTLVGVGLFDFGDIDGSGDTVRLQHVTGIANAEGDRLLLADSYNHKIKWLDPLTRTVRTLAGSGRPGAEDGSLETASFFQPEGLALWRGFLLVADTNNHALRVVDRESGEVWTIEVEGP
ncbi:MAG: alkyl hydroperoxide reductase [Planctomycetota bacterium]